MNHKRTRLGEGAPLLSPGEGGASPARTFARRGGRPGRVSPGSTSMTNSPGEVPVPPAPGLG